MELSIVLPTYNERKNIEILLPKIEQALQKHKAAAEIIVVDDSSPDNTAEAANAASKKYGNIVVVVRKNARGIASAWLHGYSIARGKYIATMDADLCHDPEDLMKLVRQLPKYDFVIGSRYMQGQGMKADKSVLPILASRIAQNVANKMLGLHYSDPTHSFRVFKREVFDAVKHKVSSQGNYFLTEFLFYAVRNGFTVAEVPITYGRRAYGKTKLNVWKEGLRFFSKATALFITARLLRK
ncbi:polyprenol monophosphomannose synthase [Candidatus Woesearchaeota archaeon]|nr:polyprenol monophosphomannose synthase [Candidatus Woesearchaeota archaeon]